MGTRTLEALEMFYDHANSIHPNIKVELRYSAENVEFLDTVVIIDGGRIEADLYTKPTDKHIYVKANQITRQVLRSHYHIC